MADWVHAVERAYVAAATGGAAPPKAASSPRALAAAGAVASHLMLDAVAEVDPEVVICSVRTPLAGRDPESLWSTPVPAKPFVFVTTLTLDVGEWLDFGKVCVVNEHDLHQDLVAAVQAAAAGEIYLSRRAVRF